MATWVENFLDACINIQSSVLKEVPLDKRKSAYGRAAKLMIDGPQGAVRELWFCETGIEKKPENIPLKNTIYMAENTFLNLITPDCDFPELVCLIDEGKAVEEIAKTLYPRLDFRTALANGLVIVSGEQADYDSEEWSQLIESFLTRIAFPFVIRSMLKTRREKNGQRN